MMQLRQAPCFSVKTRLTSVCDTLGKGEKVPFSAKSRWFSRGLYCLKLVGPHGDQEVPGSCA
jgi:hypothetical protein